MSLLRRERGQLYRAEDVGRGVPTVGPAVQRTVRRVTRNGRIIRYAELRYGPYLSQYLPVVLPSRPLTLSDTL